MALAYFSSGTSIIEAETSHITLLRDLGEQTFRETYQHETDSENMDLYVAENFQLDQVKKEWENTASQYFLIRSGETWAGYALVRWDQSHELLGTSHSLKLHRIYLLKQFWRQKLGTIFMEFILEFAKKKQFEWLWLVVWHENMPAIRFYEKWGFQHFGYEAFQYGNEITNDWVMRKKIN